MAQRPVMSPQVNLSGDPLLNVMIAYGSKTELLLDLIKTMTAESLEAENMFGDTALHVAAANNRLAVATALIKKNPPLIEWRNKKLETPLLKAALSGSVATFRKLVKCDSNIFCRTISGENVLHYAILGNNPELALEIAQEFEHYPQLKYARNSQALTPLQLLVTIPQAFRNSLELGPAESFIYTLFKRVEELEILKKNHIQTMKLLEYLAKDGMYWDLFIFLIKELLKVTESVVEKRIREPTRWSESLHKVIKELLELTDSLAKEPIRAATRWTDSPLIVGAKMGLHDFVEQILKVHPQSARLKDSEGRNVLQVAIKHGHVKIVKLIAGMISGPNPTLPSWLLWDIEDDAMKNTILHYAAETTIKREGFALQMQHEIKWFEMVKKLLPKIW
ncbi:ankyrin repeat domain-containing protein 20B-like [Dioscorea cayenensis subsp. rotundata]|uniref:Ankyrin repeat domain-containing protein 20B-like n=1 Tax=Dioscorea cayennensis subsp. rotundata TaxID=55577 RepID=A0AB40B2Z0_DIOCR|nr:ankyrin repeat domain-containing protein 20B-like [Dioscorea cayenensis subsp. rotundata]